MTAEWFDMAVKEYALNVECKPYAKQYIQKLKDKGMKLAIATASDNLLFESTLKRTGLDRMFDAIVTSKEVKRGKEFPDIYEEAARRLNLKAENCVVFEDLVVAIDGAKSGGFKTIGIFDQYSNKDKTMIIEKSDKFVQNYREILEKV